MIIYKPIKGYDNYLIGSNGTVKQLYYEVIDSYGRCHKYNEKLLSIHDNGYGYKTVGITKNKKTKKFYVHRLVAEAFIPNPNNYKYVNHIDRNTSNNNYNNLEWCTAKDNIKHSIVNIKNAQNKYKRVVIAKNINTNEEIRYSGIREAARLINGYRANIRKAILNNTIYKNNIWKYETPNIYDTMIKRKNFSVVYNDF